MAIRMGDRNQLHSPLQRARIGVAAWLDLLPEEAQSEAMMALDKFCQIAEAQMEQCYFDGNNHRRIAEVIAKLRPTEVSR